MSIRVFDFKCPIGHTCEAFVQEATRTLPCRQCGRRMRRMVSAARIDLEGFSGDFPTAADKWVSRRESHMKKERRLESKNGPDYWK